jgi:hypothetical protein
MQKFLFLFFLILFSGSLYSQQADLVFSGNFKETPFSEFVSSIENSTNMRFFFESNQVKEVRINATGNDLKMSEILKAAFSLTNLRFYIDNYNNVIIYSGTKLIAEVLPDFSQEETSNVLPGQLENADLTDAEKKYINGKISAQIETIVVGNKLKMVQDQNCVVRGRLTVLETGEPLVGATIYIEETAKGALTDPDGYFRLILKPGKYNARANFISMKEKPFYLQVYTDGFISVTVEKAVISIGEVTISAKRNDNVEGMQMGFERIATKNMKEIPVALGERDLLKVATLLPGVQTAGEGSAGIIVRGGTADQNLFYLNKIPIYNTSHIFGFFTAFSPDVVSDFTLYKSNIPASYGGRVSSIFDISTRQGNKKKFFGQGGISPVTGHFELEGPVFKDKSSFVISARSTYSDWLLSKMRDINLRKSNTSFNDFTAGLNSELNNENIIKMFGYMSSDRFTLSTTDDYNYANKGGSVSWKHLFSSSLTSDFSAIFSQYWFRHNDKKNVSEAYSHKYVINHSEFKADFNYLTPGNHKIQFGAGAILYDLDRGDILPYGEESTRITVKLGKEKGIESAVYVSDDFPVFPKLAIQAGLRYSFYGMLGPSEIDEYNPGKPKNSANITGTRSFDRNKFVRTYSGPEIRVATNYKLGHENSLKASYNRIRQYIFMLSNTMAISPDDQWKLSDYYLRPPVCDQISLGYYHDISAKGLSSSVEIYQKWVNDVVEYKDGISFISGEKTEMQLLQGKQNSYGIELMIKKNTGKTTGWLSYCYSKSSILVNSKIPEDRINNGFRYPSNYDRPHSLNLVTNMRYSRRLSFSSNLVYSTGRPITYPVAVYKYEDKYLLYYSGRNQYRVPDYFRIDCSLNMEGNLLSKKSIHSSWMLNIYNVTGRKNAYSVYFESKEGKIQGYKLSVFAQPIITLSWNFKFGNYESE